MRDAGGDGSGGGGDDGDAKGGDGSEEALELAAEVRGHRHRAP